MAPVYFASEMYQETISNCKTIISDNPYHLEAHVLAGQALYFSKQVDEAVKYFLKIYKLDSGHILGLVGKGI